MNTLKLPMIIYFTTALFKRPRQTDCLLCHRKARHQSWWELATPRDNQNPPTVDYNYNLNTRDTNP